MLKTPVEVRIDPEDSYATVRIFDADGQMFLNIHGSERYREANVLGDAEKDAHQIADALNQHAELVQRCERYETLREAISA